MVVSSLIFAHEALLLMEVCKLWFTSEVKKCVCVRDGGHNVHFIAMVDSLLV